MGHYIQEISCYWVLRYNHMCTGEHTGKTITDGSNHGKNMTVGTVWSLYCSAMFHPSMFSEKPNCYKINWITITVIFHFCFYLMQPEPSIIPLSIKVSKIISFGIYLNSLCLEEGGKCHIASS